MIGNKEQCIERLEKAKDEDLFELVKKTEKTLRSLAQNKYYFKVIVKEISNFHGYSPIETHELLKLTVGLETTTDLSTSEFKFMCEMIRDLWLQKFEVYIPKPNEVDDLRNLEQYLF